jgi:hypothetical protein
MFSSPKQLVIEQDKRNPRVILFKHLILFKHHTEQYREAFTTDWINVRNNKLLLLRTGGLNEIFRTLLDNGNKGVSNQELIRLLQKIENDATEIYHAKYGLDDKIMFNIESRSTSNSNLIGRQNERAFISQTINQEKFRFNEK